MPIEFKNFKRVPVTVHSKNGMHSAHFEAGQTRKVPDHLEDAALAKGLVPVEALTNPMSRLEQEEAAELAQIQAEQEREKIAEAERAEALAAAAKKAAEDAAEKAADAEKAKRSEAAKKAAETRKANQDAKKAKVAQE